MTAATASSMSVAIPRFNTKPSTPVAIAARTTDISWYRLSTINFEAGDLSRSFRRSRS
jgi:hypothetical protein